MTHIELLQQGKYHELSEILLYEYLGNNKRLFERDDLNRRVRILETHIRDIFSDLCTTPGANVQEAEKETISWLALPAPRQPRTYGLLLDPRKMPDTEILGPRWVRLGKGVEYILPSGFPSGAVVGGWEIQVR